MPRLYPLPIVVVTLAACAGSAEPAPATPSPASSSASSAAPTPTSSAAPAIGDVLPPLVEEAIGRVQGLTVDPSDAAIQATFSPTFLASVPADKVKALFTQLRGDVGACKEHHAVHVKNDSTALVRLQCERGAVNATVVVNPAPPHLIEGLLLKPAS
jgi:hypothetical protein